MKESLTKEKNVINITNNFNSQLSVFNSLFSNEEFSLELELKQQSPFSIKFWREDTKDKEGVRVPNKSMSEETNHPNPSEVLTNRVNSAYVAKDYTLLNGGTDNIVMIQGERKDSDPVDVLLTFDGMEEVLKSLKNSHNILEVYDIYNTKNNTYIITELCDGGDLSKFISSRKSLP